MANTNGWTISPKVWKTPTLKMIETSKVTKKELDGFAWYIDMHKYSAEVQELIKEFLKDIYGHVPTLNAIRMVFTNFYGNDQPEPIVDGTLMYTTPDYIGDCPHLRTGKVVQLDFNFKTVVTISAVSIKEDQAKLDKIAELKQTITNAQKALESAQATLKQLEST